MTPEERKQLEMELERLEKIDLPNALEDIQSVKEQGSISNNMIAWQAVQEKRDMIQFSIERVRTQLKGTDIEREKINTNNDYYKDIKRNIQYVHYGLPYEQMPEDIPEFFYNMQDIKMRLPTLYFVERNNKYVDILKEEGYMAVGAPVGFDGIDDNHLKKLIFSTIYLIGYWEGVNNEIGRARSLRLVEQYKKFCRRIDTINVKFFKDDSNIYDILK